jgi:hypothetical protein
MGTGEGLIDTIRHSFASIFLKILLQAIMVFKRLPWVIVKGKIIAG